MSNNTQEDNRGYVDYLFTPGARTKRVLEHKFSSLQSAATAAKDTLFRDSTSARGNSEPGLTELARRMDSGHLKASDISNVFRREMRLCWRKIKDVERQLQKKEY